MRNNLHALLDGIPIVNLQKFWFMHDGAPTTHYPYIVVNYVNTAMVSDELVKRGLLNGHHISWYNSSRFFFLRSKMKSIVSSTSIDSEGELKNLLVEVTATIISSREAIYTKRQRFMDWSRRLLHSTKRWPFWAVTLEAVLLQPYIYVEKS